MILSVYTNRGKILITILVILKFKSGEKHFRIERNFDKYSKKAELICEEDGEVLSVEDGDLQMLLGEMDAERYDNTVSMSQRNAQMGESIVAELKNYATTITPRETEKSTWPVHWNS